jgi:hypothetical protein
VHIASIFLFPKRKNAVAIAPTAADVSEKLPGISRAVSLYYWESDHDQHD